MLEILERRNDDLIPKKCSGHVKALFEATQICPLTELQISYYLLIYG